MMNDRDDQTYRQLRAILAQAYRDSEHVADAEVFNKATAIIVGLNWIGPELGFNMAGFRDDARLLVTETAENA